MSNQPHKYTFPTLFSIMLIDMIGIGIIIPILPLLFFQTDIFPATTSFATKTFMLGLLIAIYPLCQFFSAPLLGILSDRHGRKKILLLSLIGTALGYVLFALGIIYHSLALLIIGRIIDGLTGGNISVVMSAIADISSGTQKTKNFGMIGVAFVLGFIIGPFLGGTLTDSSLISWFNNATPFWFAFILTLLNILFVTFFLHETLSEKISKTLHPLQGLRNIKKAFQLKQLRILFIIIFLMNFGWAFFTQFFQIYLYDQFHYTAVQIGHIFAYLGIWIAISQGIVVRHLSTKFAPEKILRYSILAVSVIIALYLIPTNPIYLYLIIPLNALTFGFTPPKLSTLTSNSVDPSSQGEIFGIQQSMLALSQAIPALIAGFSLAFSAKLPIILASLTIFITGIIFICCYKVPTEKIKLES